MTTPYGSVRFRIRMEVGSPEDVRTSDIKLGKADRFDTPIKFTKDIVKFMATYQMNSIPIAQVTLALGTEMATAQDVAVIHETVQDMRIQLTARVYLRVIEIDKSAGVLTGLEFLEDEECLIFDGYVVGTSWQRGYDNANFSMHLLHWLSDLNYASSMVKNAHPGNPSDWRRGGVYEVNNLGRCGNPDAGVQLPAGDAAVRVLAANVAGETQMMEPNGDLWGNILYKWMQCLIEQPMMDKRVETTALRESPNLGEPLYLLRARRALLRMGVNTHGAPLRLRSGGNSQDAREIARAIRIYLTSQTGSNFVNTTIWGKIVSEWSPQFWFTVCPRPNDALVVPFTAGLQGRPHAIISADEYNQVHMDTQLQQILRGVGILLPMTYLAGTNADSSSIVADRTGIAGLHLGNPREGLVLLKDAPDWLATPQVLSSLSPNSTGATNKPLGSVEGIEAMIEGGQPAPDLGKLTISKKATLNRFAHQWYIIEALKGRTGELSGKLRFDIAPGSNVLIQGGNSVNVGVDHLNTHMFATVFRTTFMIDAETPNAGTAFSLAHIRTVAENGDDATSVPASPLYAARWDGARLIDCDCAETDILINASESFIRDRIADVEPIV